MIGLAASLLLLFNGRVMGISGILNRAMSTQEGPALWRWSTLAGLLLGGFVLRWCWPVAFSGAIGSSDGFLAAAGILVGFGAALGNGCTSGHGVCGISRLSLRSVVATLVFIVAGALTVLALRLLGVRA